MWKLFKNKNDINEKNVVGFISFAVMVLFAIIDLATAIIYMGYVGGGELEINDTIYNTNEHDNSDYNKDDADL